MRSFLLISLMALALCGTALAGSAVAQEKRLNLVPPKAALRGPETSDPAAPPQPAPVLAPIQPAAAPVQDASACRTDCAQSYYFCIARGEDTCPVNWSRCVLSCGPGAPPAA